MEDLFLSESDQKRQAIIETIDGNDARATDGEQATGKPRLLTKLK